MKEYVRARVYQDDVRRELQRTVEEQFADGEFRQVLDAGCGGELPIDVPPDVHLVGIDVSADALATNENVDEKIVGDLQTYPLPPGNFDAVICWWVLEHVPRPRLAIVNMARSLRPGGVLILAVPRIWSFKGLVTKLTPYWFHVWVYRRLLGYVDAGRPGVGPFRTYLHRDISPHRLVRIAGAAELELVQARSYGDVPGALPAPVRYMWRAAAKSARFITAGRWDGLASEHVAVYRKRR